MIRRMIEPLLRRVFHLYWRFARGMTLGVRAVAIDAQGRVCLIRHSYVAGWHFPGGGVEIGESFGEALARELHEEANITLTGVPVLHGIFYNNHVSRRDHVAVYVVREFRQDGEPMPNHEITDCAFFAPDALPDGTTAGTRARLAEILSGAPAQAHWV